MSFTVTIGKETATVNQLFGDVVVVRYKDKQANIQPAEGGGWKKLSGTLSQAEVDKIGRAIEKYIRNK